MAVEFQRISQQRERRGQHEPTHAYPPKLLSLPLVVNLSPFQEVYISASLNVWPLCDHIIVRLCIAAISMLLWKENLSCRSAGTFAQEWCVQVFCCRDVEYTLPENKSNDGEKIPGVSGQ